MTVSAASDVDPDRTGGVETGEAPSADEAKALRDRLVDAMRRKLEARGHQVIDVRTEGPEGP